MPDREPASVILPIRAQSPVCDRLAAGLGLDDELFVACDTAADPVAAHDPPDGVDVPSPASRGGVRGKVNALAVGMARATNDRFVWTDDDFERDPAWLDDLVAAGLRNGPVTVVPTFVGGGGGGSPNRRYSSSALGPCSAGATGYGAPTTSRCSAGGDGRGPPLTRCPSAGALSTRPRVPHTECQTATP